MGIFCEETVLLEQILFFLKDCTNTFGIMRWNRDHTKEIPSPRLAEIAKSPDFHKLILLCSESSPSVMRPAMQIALEKCTETERQMTEEKTSKKREAKEQSGPKRNKQVKVHRFREVVKAIDLGEQTRIPSPAQPAILLPDISEPEIPKVQHPGNATPKNPNQTLLPVVTPESPSSSFQLPKDDFRTDLDSALVLHEASVSVRATDAEFETRSEAEDSQDGLGSEYNLTAADILSDVSESDKENHVSKANPARIESQAFESENGDKTLSTDAGSCTSELFVRSETADVRQSREGTAEEPSIPKQDQRSVSAPQTSQQISRTIAIKPKALTIYEMKLGLVRGEEGIRKLVIEKCLPLGPNYRGNKWFSKENELQVLLTIVRKFCLRSVKGWLLSELESRIVVPGTRVGVPSTADMTNPNDILDALQAIQMTTINSKVHRAYAQMKFCTAVQEEIDGGYVPDNAFKHGVSAHRSFLGRAATLVAGNVSLKERKDHQRRFDTEYDAGRRWKEVADWFGGPGIVLIFVTAGV